MSKTLLSVVQTVAQELGIPAPASCTGVSDRQTIQLVALANDAGNDLVKVFDWPSLKYGASLLTAAGVSLYDVNQTTLGITITADRIINESGWDYTNHKPFKGALQDQVFDRMAYSTATVTGGAPYVFRMANDYLTGTNRRIQIYPTPPITQTAHIQLNLDYITDMWALRAVATNSPTGTLMPLGNALLLDSDSHPFDEMLFKYALKWRFLAAKGLAYDFVFDQYSKRLAVCMAQSGPGRTLSLSRSRRSSRLLDYANVPDTGFGVINHG